MFVMMGAAIGSSPAGKDLYEALDRWLYRLPGGLVISNLGACAMFAALTGSSPACCAAIGKMGIPEMRRRGYPDDIATGSICAGGTLGILIPPSITFILYGIATETSIGRLFLAGVIPGLMLTGLFMLWTLFDHLAARLPLACAGFPLQLEAEIRSRYRRSRRFSPSSPASCTCSTAAWPRPPRRPALARRCACVLRRGDLPNVAGRKDWWAILRDTTRESVMILTIIAAAVAVRLHAHIALPHADACAGDRRRARQPLGADGDDQPVPAGMRLLHPAGGDHPDDEPRSSIRSLRPPASTRSGSASYSPSTWRSA